MATLSATSDVFSALAEPNRRAILNLLAAGERAVNDLVALLGIAQPQVSKHLRILKEVGLVRVRKAGRRRVYELQAEELRNVHDWTKHFEQFWLHQLHELKAHAESKAKGPRRSDSAQCDGAHGADRNSSKQA